MTEKQFLRIIDRSGIRPYMLSDPTEVRFQIGKAIAILNWHIPPSLANQENSPLLPLRFRTHEINDPRWRDIVERFYPADQVHKLTVVIWRNGR